MRYIAVTDRLPRADAYCAFCTTKLGSPYIRDTDTRILYCGPNPFCFEAHLHDSLVTMGAHHAHQKAMLLLPKL
jgi:hypothetical protein